MKKNNLLPIFYFLFLLFIVSCGGDKDDIDANATPIEVSSEKQILSFEIEGFETILSEPNKTITIKAFGSDNITSLIPTIKISEKAAISSNSGSSSTIDFSKPTRFTVTAEDRTEQVYQIVVDYISGLKNFSVFRSPSNERIGEIDEVNKKIKVPINFTALSQFLEDNALIPEFDLQEGYTAVPESGTPITDPFNPIIYNIKDPDGTVVSYELEIANNQNKINVIRLPIEGINGGFIITAIKISEFSSFGSEANGLENGDYFLRILKTDDITNLPLEILISKNATITPENTTITNYSNDISYTITSQTGEERKFTLRVVQKDFVFSPQGTLALEELAFGFERFRSANNVDIVGVELQNEDDNSEIIECDTFGGSYNTTPNEKYISYRAKTPLKLNQRYAVFGFLEDGTRIDFGKTVVYRSDL